MPIYRAGHRGFFLFILHLYGSMKTVLVIEDEQFIRENIIEILQANDFHTFGAENGVQGIKLAKQHLPDLILCDVMMPDLDGHGVLKEIREHPSTASIPFIFLTARANPGDLRTGMNLGADDYLTKPFRVPDLLHAIETRLQKSHQAKLLADKKLEDLRNSISLALPHEFLTPITGVLGCSELLLTSYEQLEKEELTELITQLNVSARRLSRLIQNFILYARLVTLKIDPAEIRESAGLLGIETCESPVSMITDVVTSKAEQDHRMDDIVFSHEGHEEIAISIKPGYFIKIVEEIIDNAIKYSHVGFPITITTSATDELFLCSIHDTGRFMTAEQIASIGAYTQFDRRIYEQQGSGLGLSIAKKILELYSGQLAIKSHEGETTVRFTLPALPKTSPELL